MSIEIVSRPRKTLKVGNVVDWVQVNNPVIYKFQRKDSSFVSGVVGTGGLLKINTVDDLSGVVDVGDGIFIKSNDGVYSQGGRVVAVETSPNAILTDIIYTQDCGTGYFNYRVNWFLDLRLRDDETNNILIDNIRLQSRPDGLISTDLGSYLKSFLNYNNDFDYDSNVAPDGHSSLGFYVEYAERDIDVTVSSFESDDESTYICNGVAQIQDPGGQMMQEYQLFPTYLGNTIIGTNPTNQNWVDTFYSIEGFTYISLGDGGVAKINGTNDQIEGFTANNGRIIQFVPTLEALYVLNNFFQLNIYDSSFSLIGSIPVQFGAYDFSYALDEGIHVVFDSSNVVLWDIFGGFIAQFPGFVLTGSGRSVYDNESKTVYFQNAINILAINVDSFSISTIPVPAFAISLFVDPKIIETETNRYLAYVSNSDPQKLTLMDLKTRNFRSVDLVQTGTIDGFAHDQEEGLIYYSTSDRDLFAIDDQTFQRVNDIPYSTINNEPFSQFEIDPVNRKLIGFTDSLSTNPFMIQELPPPPLPDFLDKFKNEAVSWLGYPFDLAFVYSENLTGYPLTLTKSYKKEGQEVTRIDEVINQDGRGKVNRIDIKGFGDVVDEVCLFITAGERTGDYSADDYSSNDYFTD